MACQVTIEWAIAGHVAMEAYEDGSIPHHTWFVLVVDVQASHEGPATKSGLRNPPIENIFIGLSCGADHCGFD